MSRCLYNPCWIFVTSTLLSSYVISACTLTHTGTFGLAALTFATINTAGGVILHAIDFELAPRLA